LQKPAHLHGYDVPGCGTAERENLAAALALNPGLATEAIDGAPEEFDDGQGQVRSRLQSGAGSRQPRPQVGGAISVTHAKPCRFATDRLAGGGEPSSLQDSRRCTGFLLNDRRRPATLAGPLPHEYPESSDHGG